MKALDAAIDRALSLIVDSGFYRTPEELRSAVQHRLLLAHLSTIERQLAIITAARPDAAITFHDFEQKLRDQVADRHRSITPPHFDGVKRIPIDELYVPPHLLTPHKSSTPIHRTTTTEVISNVRRAVVLGNPGGGKSTLSQKICHDLATSSGGRTPLLVVLRDFGAAKKQHHCSIVQFIESVCTSVYQTPPPQNAVEYLLLSGRAYVVFDGLDELLNTVYREEITGDVESFSNLYPSCSVLVTSREVGYDQAPLDEKRFQKYILAPFDDGQVADYVKKWFAVDPDLDLAQCKVKSEAFLKESSAVPDLRSNPLMLALMCNIYRGEGHMPKNRPEVYGRCADMLFERWDKGRGLYVPVPFEAQIRPAMMYLAHSLYARDASGGAVTEAKLVEKATEFLFPLAFETREEAEHAAKEFIEFCRGRAWVFSDVGLTADGESLYQFTHRTFLEYFTAGYLARKNPVPEDLATLLLPRIARQEWDMVSQLAFQILGKSVDQGPEKLLAILRAYVESPAQNLHHRQNVLFFIARTLAFLVVSPHVRREITRLVVGSCIKALEQDGKEPARVLATDTVGALLRVARENRPTTSDEFKQVLHAALKGGGRQIAIASEIVASIPDVLSSSRAGPEASGFDGMSSLSVEDASFWRNVAREIFEAHGGVLQTEMRNNLPLAASAYRNGWTTLAGLLDKYGLGPLLLSPSALKYLMFPWWFDPLAIVFISEELEAARSGTESPGFLDAILAKFRQALAFDIGDADDDAGWPISRDDLDSLAVLSGDRLFAAFVLYAAMMEQPAPSTLAAYKATALRRDNSPMASIMARLFERRAVKTRQSDAVLQFELETLGWSKEDAALAIKWSSGEVDFIRRAHPAAPTSSSSATKSADPGKNEPG